MEMSCDFALESEGILDTAKIILETNLLRWYAQDI